MLTNENGPFKIKFGNATDIMELVEKLKENKVSYCDNIHPHLTYFSKKSKYNKKAVNFPGGGAQRSMPLALNSLRNDPVFNYFRNV
ncbi:unnamed protein product [Rhizophagus irregularis]|nr:unnamed protein product [Rhizophagus irregularis]